MRKLSFGLRALVGITLLGVTIFAHAQTLNTLYTFPGGANGANPSGQLVADNHGNFYGVTYGGGLVAPACLNGCGTVFELSPNGNGSWTQSVIFSFTGENGVGAYPASLLMDSHGNLFGTALIGGQAINALCGSSSGMCGMVFKLSPGSNGWTETVIHSFRGFPNDGQSPTGNILIDANGNLYGTTLLGGIGTQAQCYGQGCGTVWELSPSADGHWKEKMYSFLGLTYGMDPKGLAMDSAGNLYGTTQYGGFLQRGTVYKLTPTSKGFIGGVIFRLTNDFGNSPVGPVALDPRGNIFFSGGSGSGAHVVEVSPSANGWTGQVVATFPANTITTNGLTTDAHGNIYGTTLDTVYELQTVNGTTGIVTLATMDGDNAGSRPNLPVFDPNGNLFGSNAVGTGTDVNGTVYEIIP
jgi:uncharacterized repeat protein (TIGR03803 family)